MKNIYLRFSFFLILVVFYSLKSYAFNGYYIAGKIGTSFQQLSDKTLSVSDTDPLTGRTAYDSTNVGNSSRNVFSGGIGVGYNFEKKYNVPVRLELEYINRRTVFQSTHHSGLDFTLLLPNYGDNEMQYKSSIRTQNIMLNGYWDLFEDQVYRPYIFAGVGLAINNVSYRSDYRILQFRGSITPPSETINKFSWNAGVGINLKLNQHWDMDLGYRFTHVGRLRSEHSWSQNVFGVDADLTSDTNSKVRYHDVLLSIRYTF